MPIVRIAFWELRRHNVAEEVVRGRGADARAARLRSRATGVRAL